MCGVTVGQRRAYTGTHTAGYSMPRVSHLGKKLCLVLWRCGLVCLPAGYDVGVIEMLLMMSGDIEPNPGPALGPNNLLDVLTQLLDVSADWYKVGLALKLTPGTLNAMKGPHKEPKDCMMDMVSEWLSTSPDPTWEGLIAALRHPVVGKAALARHLEAKYCTQAPPQAGVQHIEGVQDSPLTQQEPLAAGAQPVEVVQCDPSPSPLKRPKLQPCPSDVNLRLESKEASRSLRTTKVDPLEQSNNAHPQRGEAETLQSFTCDTHQEHLLNTSNTPLSPAMAAYSDFLDATYSHMSVPPDPKGGPKPSLSYTNLAVIKKEDVSREDADEFTKATFHQGIDEIMRKKEGIELKDILKPEEGQTNVNFVLVEGAPGVGKSTFAWELCRRRHDLEAMRAFPAVVLLRLREKQVQQANSIADLLYYDDPNIQKAVVKEICSNGGKHTLFVLDGFDEVRADLWESMFVTKVISRQCLPQATILVTSRPSTRVDLLSLRRPDKHVEVIGFTHELIGQYASSIFGPGTPLLADFRRYVSTNPSIKSMMYIPLNCAIVVEIYKENRKEGRPIPQTMTQLYSELTLTRMRRHLRERGDHWDSLPRNIDDLPQTHAEVHCQLLSLATLAFDGTLKQKVIFEELPPDSSTLGLMTASQQLYVSSKGSTSYNFFHLTVQEFLSAYHVSQLPDGEQKGLFEQYSQEESSHMDEVWRFVAGLTGFKNIGWELVQSKDRQLHQIGVGRDWRSRVSPFLVRCLYEAQEKVNPESVLGRSKVVCTPRSVFDCYALGYCISVSRTSWTITMDGREEKVEALVCGLRSQEEVCGSIHSLMAVPHLNHQPIDSRALDLLADVVPNINLTHLKIGNHPTREGGTVKLLQALATTSQLHSLGMSFLSIGHDDIMSLSHLIRPSGGLKELTIGGYRMQPDCVELLLKTVLSPSSIHTLCLHGMQMGKSLLSFSPLEINCNIKTLECVGGTIASKDISCISRVLYSNATLETLWLGVGIMTIDEYDTSEFLDAVRGLAEAMKVNRSLKKLLFNIFHLHPLPPFLRSAVGKEAAQALIGALQQNQTLMRLRLPKDGRFSPEELRAIDSRVEWFDPPI